MKRFSAQFIITGSGRVLRRGIVTVLDDGTVSDIKDTGGNLREEGSVEFYNGIIIPGFVNCHCHLELSHLKGTLAAGKGLASFIDELRSARSNTQDKIAESIASEDSSMYRTGVSVCADICNTTDTFPVKKDSRIKYISLPEVFGIDPSGTDRRINEVMLLASEAEKSGLEYYIVPHSAYSVSLPLFRRIKELTVSNRVTSIHFMETMAEKKLLEGHSGNLMDFYKKAGLLKSEPQTAKNHEDVILNEVTSSGNLILVHNTFADENTIEKVKKRKNLYWCLCPNSNLHIEKVMPPVRLLIEKNCRIVVGTDSLASNSQLSILAELVTLQLNFPELTLPALIEWATLNGAKALCREDDFGSIEPGKKPGLLLIENADLKNLRLTAESSVVRLV